MAQLKQMINKNKFYIIGTLILFLFLFYCSTKLCMNVAPDEYMRYDIPLFIYNHSYLPKGDEKEILNAIWGFSYGFTPYLPSIISFFFMKIASILYNCSSTFIDCGKTNKCSCGGTYVFCML